MPSKRYVVIGVGQFGSAIAKDLSSKGAEVIALDLNEEKIESIKDEVALAVTIDSTDHKALVAQGIGEMDAAIVAIGQNFEAVVLTALNLINMKIDRVIARANGENQRRILEKIGVQEILSPEVEVAANISESLLNPSITAFLQLPDNYEIAEIRTPPQVANRTLQDIDLVHKYSLTLITLKRAFEVQKDGDTKMEEHILGVPKPETVIYDTDTLVVFGTLKNVKRFIEINE